MAKKDTIIFTNSKREDIGNKVSQFGCYAAIGGVLITAIGRLIEYSARKGIKFIPEQADDVIEPLYDFFTHDEPTEFNIRKEHNNERN